MNQINIDNLTLGQIKEIQAMATGAAAPTQDSASAVFKIGESWLFRTVTHIDVGRVTAVNGNLVTLTAASWIADTGRYSDSLKNTDNFSEVEPYASDCVVNVGSLIDATKIEKLPTKQK